MNNIIYVKNRSKSEIEEMEKRFAYCQEHLDDNEIWQECWSLIWEAVRICITKRTKATGVLLESWLDRITDVTEEFMNRYKKNSNYRCPYLFKAATWLVLKALYSSTYIKKYEKHNETNYENLDNYENTLVDSSWEDKILDKLESEGY